MPKRWSTKDLIVLEPPLAASPGTAIFRFTDDYSVFHYSKMPDQIPHKGEAMAHMASASIRMLMDAGIPTHFLDFTPPDRMTVRLLRIIDPDEQPLRPSDHNRLIPLQVICRNLLPQGASVFRRLEAGSITLADIGLNSYPRVGELLSEPVLEFTTKLEEIDRFISAPHAQALAGLSDAQFARVRALAFAVNWVITGHAQSLGLVHADSKVEFGLDHTGEVILVDTAGTLDENRFLRNQVHVSKQLMRNYYHPSGLEEEIQRWVALNRPRESWPPPQRLPSEVIELASDLYRSMAEYWTGYRIWGAPDLDSVVARLRECAAGVA